MLCFIIERLCVGYCKFKSVFKSAHHSLPRPIDGQLLCTVHSHEDSLLVFSQILGGNKAILCSAARDPKTRKKGGYYSQFSSYISQIQTTLPLLQLLFKNPMWFFYQIQFREKVLWTAITLFIFLVCCQVSCTIN